MKLAYVFDVAGVESFYVENGTAYSFKDDKPYSFFHSVDPTLFMGGWNYPFLWDGGCYLHLNEWFEKGLELRDFDFEASSTHAINLTLSSIKELSTSLTF